LPVFSPGVSGTSPTSISLPAVSTATVRPRCRALQPTLLALPSAGEIHPEVVVGLADQMDPPEARAPLAKAGAMDKPLAVADIDKREAGAVRAPRAEGERVERGPLAGLFGKLSGRGALRRAVFTGAV